VEERDEVKGRCRSVERAERCLCSLPDVVVWQRDATSALRDEDRNPKSKGKNSSSPSGGRSETAIPGRTRALAVGRGTGELSSRKQSKRKSYINHVEFGCEA
jgi:hypothetical protein